MIACQYCGHAARRAYGDEIYPHRPDLAELRFWVCDPCDARVGCHANGTPLGQLANKQLRVLRMQAHARFDPVWRGGTMTRHEAYTWLSKFMMTQLEKTHIGMYNEVQCQKIIDYFDEMNQDA